MVGKIRCDVGLILGVIPGGSNLLFYNFIYFPVWCRVANGALSAFASAL
jgi:hypothetical protein